MDVHVILLLTLFSGQCFADFEGNLAYKATAVQSSTYDLKGAAENAVDGKRDANYDSGSCSHTISEFNPWWRVDLKEVYNVSKVMITNREDCCQERIRGVQIRVGNSLKNYGNDNELAVTVSTAYRGTSTFEFEPIKGRYVNIVLPGNSVTLTLCEVEVFAETSTCSCILRNVALGAKAVQSSTYNHLGGAENAVDGNKESNYMLGSCTHTDGIDPWWRVDLKEVHRVTRVSITNRGDCCEERIEGAQIRIGNSLENNGNDNELAATVEHILPGGTETFEFKPVKGRYVNIFLPGNKYLSLCEVQVFAVKETSKCICASKNLALGAEAVQSSTYNHLGGAKNAVDGNKESNYMLGSCTHTEGIDPWWRVDLKEVHRVTRVSITNRGDCCEERIEGAQIRIGNSLENNGNDNELAATVEHILPGGTETFEFKPVKGRYVNIFLPGNKYLSLCEVQVFAVKETSKCICASKNLALGAEAVQSSTYNHLGGAKNAVDGNKESNYMLGSCTHTDGIDPWWRVDLKEVHRVTRVSITNRGDCCEERIEGAQIRIGNSLENNGNDNELVATVGFIPPGGTKSFEFKPVKGRYVNIFLPGNKYITLCEIEVYADER
ncbi:uncharacterized protein [Chanodichthys erythropterus]|uniref:uncharacterized protein n=1 Tax=Chanodichthys erythropterus TaxID=933992 RepID=UPI00351E1A76